MDKYEKLTYDLEIASELAKEKTKGMNDGGSANTDSVFIKLPRLNEEKVLAAMKKANVSCGKKTEWIGKGYFIYPADGMGDVRATQMKTMLNHLKDCGYNCLGFYMID